MHLVANKNRSRSKSHKPNKKKVRKIHFNDNKQGKQTKPVKVLQKEGNYSLVAQDLFVSCVEDPIFHSGVGCIQM